MRSHIYVWEIVAHINLYILDRMKLIYQIEAGSVTGLYSDELLNELRESLTAPTGHAIMVIPESVEIPQAIVRVEDADSEAPKFITDKDIIDRQWDSVRQLRHLKLAASDWICVVTDYVNPRKEEWISYRQALRDLPQQANPFTLVWPQAPSRA